MDSVQNMYRHFSKVASDYRQVRTTDIEPIVFIANNLKGLPEVRAADIGCGAGRYDLLLFHHIKNLYLTCIDINESMLRQAADYLISNNITNFKTLRADANLVPLEGNSMDCIFTFNAVHHFDFVKFIEKSSRAIKEDGRIFIYTRLRSQNAMNIWGRYFPMFMEKETRLYELDKIRDWVQSVEALNLETVMPFRFKRNATMEELIERVRARHYSTFSLYGEDELDNALKIFQDNIRKYFHDTNNVEWFDENILLVLRPS